MRIICKVLFLLTLCSVLGAGELHTYYGMLHSHSNFSDGHGTPAEAYEYARDVAQLDFFSLADHAFYLTEEKYEEIIDTANNFNQDNVYTALWGFEWTSEDYGHMTVTGASSYTDIYSSKTFDDFLIWLNNTDNAVAFFNHPRIGVPLEFNRFEGSFSYKVVGMELWNISRTDFYFNGGLYQDDDLPVYDEALTRGWMVGAAGSQDNHRKLWGALNDYRLAVRAEANTRADILDALTKRRFFSTLDKNLDIHFKIDGHYQGDIVEKAGDHIAEIQVSDSDGEFITEIAIIKNGLREMTIYPQISNVNENIVISTEHGDYLYLFIAQEDGDCAWSSPIFIRDPNLPQSVSTYNDNYEMFASEKLVVDSPGILGNDLYVAGKTAVFISAKPGKGNLHVEDSGAFTYVPYPGVSGKDSFSYQVFNGIEYSNSSDVDIIVKGCPVNIVNPGFESGDNSGWSSEGEYYSSWGVMSHPLLVHSGSYGMWLNGEISVSQKINQAIKSGDKYIFSVWVNNYDNADKLILAFNSAGEEECQILSETFILSDSSASWKKYSTAFTATNDMECLGNYFEIEITTADTDGQGCDKWCGVDSVTLEFIEVSNTADMSGDGKVDLFDLQSIALEVSSADYLSYLYDITQYWLYGTGYE